MKIKHWIVFILLGLIWSTSFLWIKIGVQEVSLMMLVAFRMLFGAITAIVIVVYQKAQWPRDWKTWRSFAILGPTSLAIPIFLISWGERTIDSAVASILNATVPLFTIVIAHFWLSDDKMTLQKGLGLLVGFAGVVVLLSKDLDASAENSVMGQAAVVLAAMFYAGEFSLCTPSHTACARSGTGRGSTYHGHTIRVVDYSFYRKTAADSIPAIDLDCRLMARHPWLWVGLDHVLFPAPRDWSYTCHPGD